FVCVSKKGHALPLTTMLSPTNSGTQYGLLRVRARQQAAGAVAGEEELPIRVEHAVLQDDGNDLRHAWEARRELLCGIDDVVAAPQAGEHVQARGAERVIMEPDRRCLLAIGVAVDGSVGPGARFRIVGVALVEAVARVPGVGTA